MPVPSRNVKTRKNRIAKTIDETALTPSQSADAEVAGIAGHRQALLGRLRERCRGEPGDAAREAAHERPQRPLEEGLLELDLLEVLGLHRPELGQPGLDGIDGRAAGEPQGDEDDRERGGRGDDDGKDVHRPRPRCPRSCG